MRRITVIVFAAFLLAPTGAAAGPILESAERLAAEAAAQQGEQGSGMRLSTARVGIGLAAAIAGVAMMAIDPKQPTQPRPVTDDTLQDAAVEAFVGLSVFDVIALRRAVGTPVLVCEPFCPGDIDDAILGSFATGAAAGIVAVTSAMEEQGWQLHDGQIQPFKERSQGLKYGGAALAVVGVAIAGFWSHVPVANRLAVSPTVGGFRIGTSVGF